MSRKHFIRGTIILTCTGFLTRLIGFFYRIFLSHTIGAQGMGIFQLTMPLHMLVMAISASGMQTAISRLGASLTALKKKKEAMDCLVIASAISVAISTALAFFIHNNAAFFAHEILKEPQTLPLIRLLCFCFPAGTFHSCINSYYLSRKNAAFPAGTQLLEQLVRVGSCILIYQIFLTEGREITPIIAAAGSLASEGAAALVSLFMISVHFHNAHYSLLRIQDSFPLLHGIFNISFPLTLNRVLLTLLGSIESVMIPLRLRMSGLSPGEALSIYGVFTGMALPLILFPATITNSLSAMLLPSIAELQALDQKQRIQSVVRQIFLFCISLGCICMTVFFVGGKFLGEFLFHSTTAGTYIQTMAFICPFLYLNSTLNSILNGLGKSGLCLLHSVISISVRIVFVLFVIPILGIRGYLYGILSGELLLTILHIRVLLCKSFSSHYSKKKQSHLQEE